jgi:hypothetical protein
LLGLACRSAVIFAKGDALGLRAVLAAADTDQEFEAVAIPQGGIHVDLFSVDSRDDVVGINVVESFALEYYPRADAFLPVYDGTGEL